MEEALLVLPEMDDPIVSRAVLNRLKAPSELALAQRIFDRVAAGAESFKESTKYTTAVTYDCKSGTRARSVTPAREAFLRAALLSAPGAKYASTAKQNSAPPPDYQDSSAANTARDIRALRCEFKRYSDLYADGRLLPLSVFVAALELPKAVQIQRKCYRYTPKLVELRNELVKEYLRIKRAIILQPRGSCSGTRNGAGKTIRKSDSYPVTVDAREQWEAKLCQASTLVTWWEQFERQWLQEKERHSVIALQPLVSAISAAEAVLKSCKKELILPEPSATRQRECTFRALQAFCCSVTLLADELLPVESSCLFLDASTIVLAAAIAENATSTAARSSALPDSGLNRDRTASQVETSMEHPKTFDARSKQKVTGTERSCSGSVWDDLHLAGLAEVAQVDAEDIVVYSAKRMPLCAARYLVECFLQLLQQVWGSRVCLSHVGPDLATSRPFLVSALRNFDRAHAAFQLPPSCNRRVANARRPASNSSVGKRGNEALG